MANCASGSIKIVVRPVNDVPVATDDSARTRSGVPVTIDVLANDTDPEDDELVVRSVSVPSVGSVQASARSVRFTPPARFQGTARFSYVAADGHGDTARAIVHVLVTPPKTAAAQPTEPGDSPPPATTAPSSSPPASPPPAKKPAAPDPSNHAPTPATHEVSLPEGSTVLLSVLANDIDSDGDALSLVSVGAVDHGVASRVGSRIQYTARATTTAVSTSPTRSRMLTEHGPPGTWRSRSCRSTARRRSSRVRTKRSPRTQAHTPPPAGQPRSAPARTTKPASPSPSPPATTNRHCSPRAANPPSRRTGHSPTPPPRTPPAPPPSACTPKTTEAPPTEAPTPAPPRRSRSRFGPSTARRLRRGCERNGRRGLRRTHHRRLGNRDQRRPEQRSRPVRLLPHQQRPTGTVHRGRPTHRRSERDTHLHHRRERHRHRHRQRPRQRRRRHRQRRRRHQPHPDVHDHDPAGQRSPRCHRRHGLVERGRPRWCTFDVLANDTDPDSDPLSVSSFDERAWPTGR